jgi:hypothetical protein
MSDALLTPSKITAWLDCGWYLTLKNSDRQVGPFAELLMEKGLAQEAACLAEGSLLAGLPDCRPTKERVI